MAVTSLREKQKALTREMLVDAAYAAFEEKGYVDATVDDIVRRASASRPSRAPCTRKWPSGGAGSVGLDFAVQFAVEREFAGEFEVALDFDIGGEDIF